MGLLDPPGLTRRQLDARTDGPLAASARNLEARVSGKPAQTATPTITLSTSQPAATPTNHYAWSGSAYFGGQNPEFTFLGGRYNLGGTTYPFSIGARLRGAPNTIGSYGNAIVEFVSDAPSLAWVQNLGEGGAVRVLVDGTEVYRCAAALRTGTAQAGAASTVTLDTGASATNGVYATKWVRITGGTGAGQVRQITGYVGSTKVATVHAPWTTVPDSTSTFEIAHHRLDNNTGTGNLWAMLSWTGERRLRRYRVECAMTGFYGVQTAAIDTVAPAPPSLGTPTVWCGDSFSEGAGTEGAPIEGLAAAACRRLGWSLIHASLGGSGWLAVGQGTTFRDRVLPPANAWWVAPGGGTAGSYTLSQDAVTTGAIAYNATAAAVQTALDTAFGAGLFAVVGTTSQNGGYVIYGRSTKAAVTSTMTADFSGVTGGLKHISRYLGEIATNAPLDGDGNVLPFNLVLAGGRNDSVAAGYTRAALVTRVTEDITALKAAYPMARIWVINAFYLPGAGNADVTNAAADILSGATAAGLPKIKGVLPVIDTLSWFSGSGYLGAQTGTGNSDVSVHTDGIHPTPFGHNLYAARIAQAIGHILGREISP